MKQRILPLLLALLLLPALLLPAAAAEPTTNFKTLKINSVTETPHTLDKTGADVTVLVVGRVNCGLTQNCVRTATRLMEQRHVEKGRVYLLDMDQDQAAVENFANNNPAVHVAWNNGERTYQNLFWEITSAYYPGISGSATLPALCVLDENCAVLYYASGSGISADKLEEALTPYMEVPAAPNPTQEPATTPENPTQEPENPSQPETPETPEEPAQPETPETPEEPSQPEAPEEPTQQPETPTTPAQPSGFQDVKTTDYFYAPVAWAVSKGITTGTSAQSFGPETPCTRAQVVTFLWRAAGSPAPTGGAAFADVQDGDYFRDAVLWAVGQGITNGTGDGYFSPDNIVTRGQVVTFLHRSVGSPAASGSTFTDVVAGEYYTTAVHWAVALDITNGVSPSTFGPGFACTRGQVVTFLYRCMAE